MASTAKLPTSPAASPAVASDGAAGAGAANPPTEPHRTGRPVRYGTAGVAREPAHRVHRTGSPVRYGAGAR